MHLHMPAMTCAACTAYKQLRDFDELQISTELLGGGFSACNTEQEVTGAEHTWLSVFC